MNSVIQYLCTRVGEGSLRLSDIYFSWPRDKRHVLQRARRGKYADNEILSANGLSREELELFESLRGRQVFSGDMYDYVSGTEVVLHRLVREVLERKLGADDAGWWREGIPVAVREKCAARREVDEYPSAHAYAYTTLIDLSIVMSKNWTIFQSIVPREYATNRKRLEDDLRRLNAIRNAVMHPVKERKWTEEDFEFVRSLLHRFNSAHAMTLKPNVAEMPSCLKSVGWNARLPSQSKDFLVIRLSLFNGFYWRRRTGNICDRVE